MPFVSFSKSLPFIFCGVRFSYTPSRVLNFKSRSVAVFGPTPATPGMLSDESPMSAFRSIKRIGSRAFYRCARLEEVTVEAGAETIGALAFAGAYRLGSVTLPRTVKRLGFGAFGLGFTREKLRIYVDSEFMKRRITMQLRLCLSFGRAEVVVTGKSIEERKRERRRSELRQKPTHLIGE